MPTRITRLTDEQKAAIPDHVRKWIDIGRCTDEADWATFESAAAACYRHAGLTWHGRVVRVGSPLALSLAAPIAAHLLAPRDGAVVGAVRDAVHGAVDDAVHGAVGRAVVGAWWRYLGGQWWTAWQARTAYYRDVCGLDLPGDLWDRDRAYAAAQCAAGWWWPHREWVMVCDRPRELHLEQVGPAGWGSHRLHRADGPAISWRDGWGLHFWHGTRVPADLIEGDGWTPERILREPNVEIRRCAIERIGWDRFVTQAGLTPVATAPDPGNPGAAVDLYDLPEQIFEEPVRLAVVRNGTLELDGSWRHFGLTVPASISDPVAAAAWSYDDPESPVRMTPELYARITRRT